MERLRCHRPAAGLISALEAYGNEVALKQAERGALRNAISLEFVACIRQTHLRVMLVQTRLIEANLLHVQSKPMFSCAAAEAPARFFGRKSEKGDILSNVAVVSFVVTDHSCSESKALLVLPTHELHLRCLLLYPRILSASSTTNLNPLLVTLSLLNMTLSVWVATLIKNITYVRSRFFFSPDEQMNQFAEIEPGLLACPVRDDTIDIAMESAGLEEFMPDQGHSGMLDTARDDSAGIAMETVNIDEARPNEGQ